MSIAQDITRISVQGQKESIVRMLNAVLSNLEVDRQIAAEDSLETVNQKIKDESDGYGYRIRIPDLLEAEMLQRPEIQKKMAEFKPDDDPCLEFFTARAIDILSVRQSGEDDYSIDLELYECEPAYYEDWIWWDDIVSLYGCKVYLDDDLFYNGNFDNYCGAIIYEQGKDGVKRTEIKPELNLVEYKFKFDDLIKINPERYRPLKIKYFKDKIARMEHEVKCEEAEIEREYWAHRSAKDIDKSIWKEFVLGEGEGPDGVKSVYDWYLDRPLSYHDAKTHESIDNVLILRMKKWTREDAALFDCYCSLISDFRTAAAAKEAEYRQWKTELEERNRQENLKKCAERRNEFLLRSAMVEPEVRPIVDLNDEEEEEIIGHEYHYYVCELIDDVEYQNEYSMSRKETDPGKLRIDFRSTSRAKDEPYDKWLCTCTLLIAADQYVALEQMNKSAFFDLLNSNACHDVEPLSKDAPMIFTSSSDYEQRFKDLGFEIHYISKDATEDGEDDLPF